MSKSLFSVVIVALVFFLVATTTLVAAMPIARNRIDNKHAQLRSRLATPGTCIGNISLAGIDLGDAVKEVFVAIGDCSKVNNTDGCVADIAQVGNYLSRAADRVNYAITACGGQGSACATDLLNVASALTDAARRVALAIEDCKGQSPGQCLEQIVKELGDLQTIVTNIQNAITQCKTSLTKL